MSDAESSRQRSVHASEKDRAIGSRSNTESYCPSPNSYCAAPSRANISCIVLCYLFSHAHLPLLQLFLKMAHGLCVSLLHNERTLHKVVCALGLMVSSFSQMSHRLVCSKCVEERSNFSKNDICWV